MFTTVHNKQETGEDTICHNQDIAFIFHSRDIRQASLVTPQKHYHRSHAETVALYHGKDRDIFLTRVDSNLQI